MRTIKKINIEEKRKVWSEVAQENDWYVEPFFIQIWVDKNGDITDSVSFRSMTKDIVCDSIKDKQLTEGLYYY